MKITTQKKIASLLVASSVAAFGLLPAETVVTEPAPAATASTTTTTTSNGTFTEFAPGTETMTLRSESGPASYVITKRTTVVDEAGAPVAISSLAPGRPMAVHYVREGDRMIASRIIVRAPVAATAVPAVPREEVTTTRTTTTEMPGTITEFDPGQTVIVRGETTEPNRYLINKRTTYVDETGAPIAVERIAPGAPVTVRYINEGGHMVASQIVVRAGTKTPRDAREERRELKRDYKAEKERLEHEEKALKREERRERD